MDASGQGSRKPCTFLELDFVYTYFYIRVRYYIRSGETHSKSQTRLKTLHVTVLMDEDADTDNVIRAHGNVLLLL